MAYISFQPTDFFNTLLWTGDGNNGRSITGVGFQPDMVWVKEKEGTNNHMLSDSVRGANNKVNPNTSAANDTATNSLQAFGADGFTAGTNTEINANGNTYVAWNWRAGTTSGISAGAQTITPSAYSINASAGWGIYKWSRTGASTTDYFSHGLGATPTIALQKRTDGVQDWYVNFTFFDGTMDYMNLNDTDSKYDGTTTLPTSTNWYPKSPETGDYMTYLFVPKKGFSSFGTYVGSAQLDGPFIFTGFRPAFVMVKITDTTDGWYMWDNRRSPSGGYNAQQYRLEANQNSAQGTSANYIIDMVSNGFKLRDNNVGCNGNGNSFVYMAFAEFPFVSSNSKACTAR